VRRRFPAWRQSALGQFLSVEIQASGRAGGTHGSSDDAMPDGVNVLHASPSGTMAIRLSERNSASTWPGTAFKQARRHNLGTDSPLLLASLWWVRVTMTPNSHEFGGADHGTTAPLLDRIIGQVARHQVVCRPG